MDKCAKIFLAVCTTMAIAFAQASDTAANQQSIKQAAPASGTTISSVNSKPITTNVTPKAPTNWSKIKDLFL